MIDTDMEDASARMNALQTQQQLAIQSLQIANSQPQAVLSLFRYPSIGANVRTEPRMLRPGGWSEDNIQHLASRDYTAIQNGLCNLFRLRPTGFDDPRRSL
ncbi:hypothetical protein GSF67_07075 [Agrobacterium sp. CGMCC 11546]|nr:hypothetical protein GSF67_07075 [Agrobacterium sp. CGMCC 11546]